MYVDNNETPGCEGTNLNCYPLKWTTTPEIYEEAGVSWQVYQDTDNFDVRWLLAFSTYTTDTVTGQSASLVPAIPEGEKRLCSVGQGHGLRRPREVL